MSAHVIIDAKQEANTTPALPMARPSRVGRSNMAIQSNRGFRRFTEILVIATTLLLVSSLNFAQAVTISVHPEHVAPHEPFLILLDEDYSTNCNVEFSVRISPESIDLVNTQVFGLPCPPTLGPAQKRLFNPLDMVEEGYEFAAEIEIRFLSERPDATIQIMAFELLRFAESDNLTKQVQTGSWIRQTLAQSGLFIDQQADVLSFALLDYAQDGGPLWLFSAGPVRGDAYISDLVSYAEIACETGGCDRASPIQSGRIYAVLDDRNSIVVAIEHAFLSEAVGHLGPWDDSIAANRAFDYQRLDFQRHPTLASGQAPRGFTLPDLVGTWVGGTTGSPKRAPNLNPLRISYAGRDLDPPIERHTYRVFGTTPKRPGAQFDPDAVLFNIVCADTELEPPTCFLQGYQTHGGDCSSDFKFGAVGAERLSAAATCSDRNGVYETRFELFRVD